MKPEQAPAQRTLSGIALTPDERQSKAGLYRSETSGYVELVFRDGKLLRGGGPELIALDKLRFTTADAPEGLELQFDGQSPSRSFDLRQPGQETLRFDRLVPVTLSASDLKTYIGEFHSPELDATGRIIFESDSLAIEIGDGAPVRLRSVAQDLMRAEQGGDIVFERDSMGKIVRFYLNAGRVRKLEFQRR
jgi:hypothetical protein